MSFDLHTHTTASDGALSPSELLQRAQLAGIHVLAITDHDTIDGVREAQSCLQPSTIAFHLITGVEISSQWAKNAVHIVGLNFDVDDAQFNRFIEQQKILRGERNEKILQRLDKQGFGAVRTELLRAGATVADLGRPQIAAALVKLGAAPTVKKVFKRFLVTGGSASPAMNWPSLEESVGVIRRAGGDAVLAHPLHYRLTGTKLRALLTEFKHVGGAAIEVVSGGQNAAQTKHLAALARALNLKGSMGSDFHSDLAPWQTLGKLGSLPAHCEPVWRDWPHLSGFQQ